MQNIQGTLFVHQTFLRNTHVQDLYCFYSVYTLPNQRPKLMPYVEAVSIEELVKGMGVEVLQNSGYNLQSITNLVGPSSVGEHPEQVTGHRPFSNEELKKFWTIFAVR